MRFFRSKHIFGNFSAHKCIVLLHDNAVIMRSSLISAHKFILSLALNLSTNAPALLRLSICFSNVNFADDISLLGRSCAPIGWSVMMCGTPLFVVA